MPCILRGPIIILELLRPLPTVTELSSGHIHWNYHSRTTWKSVTHSDKTTVSMSQYNRLQNCC
jgi:hypothetical protein